MEHSTVIRHFTVNRKYWTSDPSGDAKGRKAVEAGGAVVVRYVRDGAL